jgi:glucose/arabinose dehydrogenase/uncharacterized cupredoxin-like copper-binding protein
MGLILMLALLVACDQGQEGGGGGLSTADATDFAAESPAAGDAEPAAGTTAAESTASLPEPGQTVAIPDAGGTVAVPDAGETIAVPDPGGTIAVPDAGGTAAVPDAGGTAAPAAPQQTPAATDQATAAATAAASPEATASPAAGATPEAEQPAEDSHEGHSVAPVAQPGGDLPGEPAIQLVKVADGLVDPVNVAIPADGSGRIFIVERPGMVRIVQDGQLLEEPFMDISDITLSAFLEQGLYDIAFHPDFASNGLFYLHFAEMLRNGDSMIVEYQVSAEDPNLGDRESGRVILQIEQPFANHNGGELAFGPDGMLYIGSGDGGWEGDPLEAGQDLSTLLGKILRIDVNVPAGEAAAETRPYSIPADNPFAQPVEVIQLFDIPEGTFAQIHTEARPEIWAYGLRNPWKFNFDSATGDLYIADVGQNHWEEINFVEAGSPAGMNFGWDILMGSYCHPIELTECPTIGVLPVAEYNHDLGHAVVGMGVYRGAEFPTLQGIYYAGDWGSGRIWGLMRDESQSWQFEELLDTDLHLSGAGESEDGAIYVTSCECEYGEPDAFANPPGSLWRLVAADQLPEGAEVAPLGGDEEEAEAATTPAAGGEVVTVSLVDGAIEMSDTLAAGTYTFEVTNNGTMMHNFEIEGQGMESAFEADLEPGETRSMTVELAAGTYEVYCPVGNHRAQGMELELTVS